MAAKPDFQATFLRLRSILEPYARNMIVVHDTGSYYYLDTKHVMKNKHRLFFGAARVGKAYVSFHLMPVYGCRELLEGISPELKRHMQGKACFNFRTVDEKLLKELAKLTRAGAAKFKSPNFL